MRYENQGYFVFASIGWIETGRLNLVGICDRQLSNYGTMELWASEARVVELGLPIESGKLYEQDFYAWTQQQAEFLREGKWHCLDASNLVEEIESLGRQERRELENRLGILLGNLLKWEFQPDKRSKSWFATIRKQRRQILKLLDQSPSLKPYLPEALEEAYQNALDLAVRETSLGYKDFPAQCPYEFTQALDAAFFPGQQLESDSNW